MGFMGDSARTLAQIFSDDKPKNIPEEKKAFAEILTEYAKENKTVTIPEIQKHFSVNYYTAFEAVKSLVESQVLKFTGGINYECLVKEAPADEPLTDLEKANAEHRAFPDARVQEFIKRLRSGKPADDNDDNNADDRSDNVQTDEEKLRYKALKFCVAMNEASVSMLQRKFPIGYIRACKLIDWMEDKGYVSVSEGTKPRKVLITQEEFDKLFTESGCEEVLHFNPPDDDIDEEDLLEVWDKLEQDDSIESARRCVINGLNDGVNVITEGDQVYIELPDTGMFHPEKKFKLVNDLGSVYFTDQGAALHFLRERGMLDEKGIKDEMDSILQCYGIEIIDDELTICIREPEESLKCLLYLYVAVERIYNLDQLVISTYFEKFEEDKKCWEVMRQIIKENRDCTLKQLIRNAKKRYNAAKSSGDFDAIFYLVRAIKEFLTWTQLQYDFCRRDLLNSADDDSDSGGE